jgi:hypothetical protein
VVPTVGGVEAVKALQALAWANAVLHAAGLIVAWFAMQPGSVGVPLAERMAYLAGRPAGWSLGWGIWMLCTFLLLAFMTVLRQRLSDSFPNSRGAMALLALLFTAAGMAVDLLCDVIQIQVLPRAAATGPDLFLAFERLAFTGGLTVANGLYTAGVLLMNLRLRGHVGSAALLAGWVTAVAGFALAAAGFVPSTILLQVSTGTTIVAYSLWTVLVARDLR